MASFSDLAYNHAAVMDRISIGQKSLANLITHLKTRAKTHESLGQSMCKLATSDKFEEGGTAGDTWKAVKVQTEGFGKLTTEVAKAQKELEKVRAEWQRAKAKFEKTSKEMEKTEEAWDKKDSDGKTLPAALEKLVVRWRQLKEQVGQDDVSYMKSIDLVNEAQTAFGESMSSIHARFETLEEERVDFTTSLLSRLMDSFEELAKMGVAGVGETREVIGHTDKKADIEAFVSDKKKAEEPPEVEYEEYVSIFPEGHESRIGTTESDSSSVSPKGEKKPEEVKDVVEEGKKVVHQRRSSQVDSVLAESATASAPSSMKKGFRPPFKRHGKKEKKKEDKMKEIQDAIESVRVEERHKLEEELEKVKAAAEIEKQQMIELEVEMIRQEMAASSSGVSTPADDQDMCLPREMLEMSKLLGSGGYGDVYLADYLGTQVAVKKLRTASMNSEAEASFLEEFNSMKQLRHPNIVLLMGVVVKEPPYLIVTEFAGKGSLYDVMYKQKTPLSLWRIFNIFVQSCRGMAYLHGRDPQVVHRDLKTANLLMTEEFVVKIADFGLSRVLRSKDDIVQSVVGTVLWMAPEVMQGEPYTAACDVYSFAMIMYEVFEREMPFQDSDLNEVQVMFKVAKGQRPVLKRTPPAFRPLIERCWDQDCRRRPSFTVIMEELERVRAELSLSEHNQNPGDFDPEYTGAE